MGILGGSSGNSSGGELFGENATVGTIGRDMMVQAHKNRHDAMYVKKVQSL